MRISSSRKHNLSHTSHKHHHFCHMKTTRIFVTNTRWGNSATTTSTLNRHLKKLKTTESCIFDFLPQDILIEIKFLASGLEHRDKIKAVITKIHHLLKTIISATFQELWDTYHNFGVYSCWYNKCYYTWSNRSVTTNTHLHYKNILASYSTVITTLTRHHIDFTKSITACHHITWDEDPSVPYFEQPIQNSSHDIRILPTFPGWQPRIQNLLSILFYCNKISFYIHFQIPFTTSCVIVTGSLPRHFVTITSYLYVLRQYYIY